MTPTLRERFLFLQKQLAAHLEADRANISHPGSQGSATETGWRNMLGEYLPRRYCVTDAFVIDSRGHQSQQIDLVIHDQQYSPFLFKQHGATFIPAESVYAVFEVKPSLSKAHITYAAEKAASVRNLFRTSAAIYHVDGVSGPNPPKPILAGLLCSGYGRKPRFGESLRQYLAETPKEGRLDLICALNAGAFEVSYPDRGLPDIDVSAPEAALIFFFLRLLERLQRLGTVTAMDLRQYGEALK